ncbi:phospholipase D-like domain-containing protein [Zavarzinella formosa]|uniref:phospholipase D-like domain-containing protein n=1 Tax=Zavarzinella formosa TaxID=360055 RepID=UPI00031B85A5|nr:phospholipase D-like domain-containing protein [Zavarzinella formosa]
MAKKRAKTPSRRGPLKWFFGLILAVTGIAPVSGYEWVIDAYHWLSEHRPVSANPGEPETAAGNNQTGTIRIYFSTPDLPPGKSEIAAACVAYIDQTKSTLDVAAFELDNKVITEALVRAVNRGVRVRVATETNYLQASGIHALKAVGVTVIDDQRDGALMHDKFMVFDNKAVWTGSMNFTENCAYKNNNNGIFIESRELAENYTTKFGWMFELHKFGGAPSRAYKIPHPTVTLSDGTVIENYFSTHDHIAEHVITETNKARQVIHFLAFSFTHDGIGKSMLGRAKAGVEVQGVFEKTQAAGGHTEYEKFRAAGQPVQVYLDANPRNMHHKVIVVDGQTTVAGSFNFSESADKSNDENVVIIRSPSVAKLFEEEFQRVYGAAKARDGR